MAETIQIVNYYYAQISNLPGAGRRIFEHVSEHSVNLIAFTAFPVDKDNTQLDFIVDNVDQLKKAAKDAGIALIGPKKAFLIQGDDRIGALHDHHLKLANAGISVISSNGVIDGKGRFGFVLWVEQEQVEKAARALAV